MPVRLPPQTAEVRFLHNHILSLEAASPGPWLVLRTRAGAILRRIQAGAGLDQIRAAEIKDFTLDPQLTIIASLGVAYSLGRASRILAFYPPSADPRFLTLDDTVCLRLAADPSSGAWCLGPALDDALLHRVSGPAAGAWSLLPKKKVRLLANPGGDTRGPYDSGQLGVPSLISAAPGRLLAFFPNAVALYDCDIPTATFTPIPLPFNPQGRSNLSFAAHAQTTLGLFPTPLHQPDRLNTPYILYTLEAGAWRPLPNLGRWMRGASLAGLHANTAAVWNRAASALEFVTLP